MEISYGLVNLMYFMLCDELNRIKGSRSNKRRKLLTCFTNSLFKVYNNLSLRETGPEVYNTSSGDAYKRFKLFRQKCEFIFEGPLEGVDEKKQVRHLLLWVGDTGLEISTQLHLIVKMIGTKLNKCLTNLKVIPNHRVTRY